MEARAIQLIDASAKAGDEENSMWEEKWCNGKKKVMLRRCSQNKDSKIAYPNIRSKESISVLSSSNSVLQASGSKSTHPSLVPYSRYKSSIQKAINSYTYIKGQQHKEDLVMLSKIRKHEPKVSSAKNSGVKRENEETFIALLNNNSTDINFKSKGLVSHQFSIDGRNSVESRNRALLEKLGSQSSHETIITK